MAKAGFKKKVKYVPPSPEAIEEMARKVCRRLADTDPQFNEADVVFGFASFLSVVAKMHTNNLNKRSKTINSSWLDTDN